MLEINTSTDTFTTQEPFLLKNWLYQTLSDSASLSFQHPPAEELDPEILTRCHSLPEVEPPSTNDSNSHILQLR